MLLLGRPGNQTLPSFPSGAALRGFWKHISEGRRSSKLGPQRLDIFGGRLGVLLRGSLLGR